MESGWIAGQLGWTRHRRQFDELDVFNKMLAIGETIAHLDVLITSGLVRRHTADGLILYSAVPQARPA